MVVLVQPVGHSSKPSQGFQSANDSRFDNVARPVQLGLGWAVFLQSTEFLVDGGFQLLRLDPRFGRSLNVEDRSQNERQQVFFGVTRLIDRVADPRYIDAWQLHLVGNREPPL